MENTVQLIVSIKKKFFKDFFNLKTGHWQMQKTKNWTLLFGTIQRVQVHLHAVISNWLFAAYLSNFEIKLAVVSWNVLHLVELLLPIIPTLEVKMIVHV